MRVIGGAFQSIAKEMGSVLFRMSYSSIIRESEDLGAGLFDADGNVLAESDSTPMFMGAMPKIVKGVICVLGDDIHDGDVILHNDPYKGATHSPDVGDHRSDLLRGELVGFSGASAHLIDNGGAYPGLWSIDLATSRPRAHLPRSQALREGRAPGIADPEQMLNNIRTPTHNRGDIEAMIAGCERGKRRFLALIERYGMARCSAPAQIWLDYSERMLRQEIAKMPDGVYETEVATWTTTARTTARCCRSW